MGLEGGQGLAAGMLGCGAVSAADGVDGRVGGIGGEHAPG